MRLEMLERAGEVRVKWRGRLLYVYMQEGRIPKEWRMGLNSADMEEESGCA